MNAIKPNATFANFIASLCGDKQAVAAVRQEAVRSAIVVALKGTKEHWLDAAAVAGKGKGAAAKALLSGFMAVGMIAVLIKPQEAVTAEERADRIAVQADILLEQFEAAYNEAMPKDKTAAEKETAKAEKDAKKAKEVSDGVEAAIKARGLVAPETLATDAQVLALALTLITGGKLGDALAGEFRAALGFNDAISAAKSAAYDAGRSAGFTAGVLSVDIKHADTATEAATAIQSAKKGAKRGAKLAAVA